MARPGPKPRPPLQVVREGNPNKQPVKQGIVIPSADLVEPDWQEIFPVVSVPAKPRAPRGADEGELAAYRDEVAAWQRVKVAAEGSNRCRGRASKEWSRVVPVLRHTAGLGVVDFTTLVDYCACVARLEWCEYRISVEGLIVQGQRGSCRNPLTTVAAQYRTQLKTYIGEFGLSPSSRGRISPPGDDDDGDDVFD